MSTDDRTETITDRAAIRDSDEPSELGDFPCCSGERAAGGVDPKALAHDLTTAHALIEAKSELESVRHLLQLRSDALARVAREADALRADRDGLHREWRVECDLRQDAQRIASERHAEVDALRAKVAEGRRIIGSLAETVESECDDDPDICHEHDRYEGRCALLTDLERALAALATGEGK